MSSSLLITGASGFVGKSLLSTLATSHIPGIKNLHIPYRNQFPQIDSELFEEQGIKVTLYRLDLTEQWDLDIEVDAVINLAAEGLFEPYSVASSLKYEKINANFVNWLIHQERMPKRILHTSTGACYGRFTRDKYGSVTKMSSNGWEKSGFVESRVRVENLLRDFANMNSINLVVARLFTFSGVGLLNRGYAISRMIREAIDKNKITIESNPLSTRSYLDEHDLGASLVSLLKSEKVYETVDIGAQEEVTLQKLALCISDLTGAKLNSTHNNAPVDYYVPSVSVTNNPNVSTITATWEQSLESMITVAKSSGGRPLE